MADLVLAGNTSGTVTVSVPAVAGTNTVTIAAQTGTLNAAPPCIKATAGGSQTISNATYTKATLVENLDTNNNFATSTFTPTVAGYYQVNGVTSITAGTSIASSAVAIYKNGVVDTVSFGAPVSSITAYASVATIIYMNGTTDTIDLYVRGSGSGTLTVNSETIMTATLIRGA